MFHEMEYPGVEDMPVANFPVVLSKTPGQIRNRPPTCGEHTDEVLGALGYTSEQLDNFRELRVI